MAPRNDRDVRRGGAADQALRAGVALHQRGRPAEAAEIYRRVLATDPENAEANHLMGLVLHQAGRHAEAATLIGKAVARAPRNPDYHANLGVVLKVQNRFAEAVDSYRRSLQLAPRQAGVLANLGVALLELERPEEAAAAVRQAIRIAPTHAEAHATLGVALLRLDQADEAVRCLSRSLELRPGHPATLSNHALALSGAGRVEEACAEAKRAVDLQPRSAVAHQVLGSVLLKAGDIEGAVGSFSQSVAIRPDATVYTALGKALFDLDRRAEASRALVAAMSTGPANGDAYETMGSLLLRLGEHPGASQCFAKLLELKPDDPRGHVGMGAALLGMGRLAEAEAACKAALLFDPDNLAARGMLLFAGNYRAETPVAAMVAEARAFGDTVAAVRTARTEHPNDPDPARRLKVGLVSGDFYSHPVGRFLEAPLANIDPARIELFAYSTNRKADALTEAFKRSIPHWRQISYVGDNQVASMIAQDGIDILLDLSGHTTNNRVPLFAMKPAPIAVTWLGYFATTGVAAIDYVLCNRWVVPAEEETQWVEKPWRLPDTYLCFSRPEEVPIGPLPALAAGHVTFGSANNLNKLSDETVRCWAGVLNAVPHSRLELRAKALGNVRAVETTRARFAAYGIGPERLGLEGSTNDYAAHLARYNSVDIALDPFPYAGGTTTVEALWMGVPVLTLKGDRYVAHMGESIMHNMELPDWIAADTADYVAKAAAAAADTAGLAALRASLRQRLLASPLMDAPRFARNLETAFRGMWEIWCAGRAR